MANRRSNPKGPKKRVGTRIDPELHDWLARIQKREGWDLTSALEWVLSGVRYLEQRLGGRLAAILDEQRAGGDDLFTAVAKLMETAMSASQDDSAKPIVPPSKKRPRLVRS